MLSKRASGIQLMIIEKSMYSHLKVEENRTQKHEYVMRRVRFILLEVEILLCTHDLLCLLVQVFPSLFTFSKS